MTREGIFKRIPWNELGISNIKKADDGVNALNVLNDFQPDIVLTDVRMPRMDGVELSYKLREAIPDCKIIFMSGYSDKEYLKSAIKLKAIDYVEKPINITELKSVIGKAVELCLCDQNKKKHEQLINSTIQLSKPIMISEIVLQLVSRHCDIDSVIEYIQAVGLDIQYNDFFNTVIIKIPSIEEIESGKLITLKSIVNDAINKTLLITGIAGIFGFKEDGYFIIHLYSHASHCNLFTTERIYNFCSILLEHIKKYSRFFICIGTKVNGINNIYLSYDNAVVAMQRSFFKDYNSIILYKESHTPPFTFDDSLLSTFKDVIINNNNDGAIFFAKSLSSELRRYDNTLVSKVKYIFLKLSQILLDISINAQVDTFNEFASKNMIWEYIHKINTLSEMENFLIEKINNYYTLIHEQIGNRRIVKETIKYIQKHYQDETLSINSISEFISLSQTYICYLFKEETGQTLNQYITEYRISKSKMLLKDVRLRVCEVSSAVGYADANYFSKIFRKTTGLTPSEYREKEAQ